uniref:Uncharacterized protein n=1 Tax=Chromera velia CCMP2878 TaxID=1169474 RepID=A0A0G4HX76_9ALVE|eukprot:Cvel_9188.t1-p1 / transcript=Cvel_9188.t1 / gene=Cvel_9188 / organism=Chromera_velia_CCMP2878 / gene_product=hypothetical protein / transcript_product=hypothetical protein / location=Cvel_scaffold523:73379-74808(+) / protein_length=372 / sequence_SO=supercontig / SO=protein_coding / is_pseudo=false
MTGFLKRIESSVDTLLKKGGSLDPHRNLNNEPLIPRLVEGCKKRALSLGTSAVQQMIYITMFTLEFSRRFYAGFKSLFSCAWWGSLCGCRCRTRVHGEERDSISHGGAAGGLGVSSTDKRKRGVSALSMANTRRVAWTAAFRRLNPLRSEKESLKGGKENLSNLRGERKKTDSTTMDGGKPLTGLADAYEEGGGGGQNFLSAASEAQRGGEKQLLLMKGEEFRASDGGGRGSGRVSGGGEEKHSRRRGGERQRSSSERRRDRDREGERDRDRDRERKEGHRGEGKGGGGRRRGSSEKRMRDGERGRRDHIENANHRKGGEEEQEEGHEGQPGAGTGPGPTGGGGGGGRLAPNRPGNALLRRATQNFSRARPV